jgi:hypothetical protein
MSMREFKISLDLFPQYDLRILTSTNMANYTRIRNKIPHPLDDREGEPSLWIWEDNNKIHLWIVLHKPCIPDNQFINTVTHEISHMAFHIESRCKIDDNEFRAYLTGYLSEIIMKWLGIKYITKKRKIQ